MKILCCALCILWLTIFIISRNDTHLMFSQLWALGLILILGLERES